MPMVGGKKFPYTAKGKEQAKKEAERKASDRKDKDSARSKGSFTDIKRQQSIKKASGEKSKGSFTDIKGKQSAEKPESPYSLIPKGPRMTSTGKKAGVRDASKIRQGAKKAGIQRMLEKKRKGFSGAKPQLY
jgi:hypothetical protein